jgi:rare lipoprotein A
VYKRITSIYIAALLTLFSINCTTTSYSGRNKYAVRPSSGRTKKRLTNKYELKGIASYYSREFHGRKTASGERFNMRDLTAAHKTLPFNTRVKVINLENNKTVIVRINDRGPFKKGRVIDLSYKAAKKIGLIKTGTANVKLVIQ